MKTNLFLGLIIISLAGHLKAAEPDARYLVYVSNERSGDVSVLDPETNETLALIPVGKRPRGIHCSPDGKRVYVALSGSPRMAPGVDRARAQDQKADKSADGIGVIDAASRDFVQKLNAGSDPEQFALNKEGTRLFVANEDVGTASIMELPLGTKLGEVKVADEPEGVSVNPATGEVYITCEEQGEVYVIDPVQSRSVVHFKVGARPRSVAFSPDGSRAYIPAEASSLVSIVNTVKHEVIGAISLGEGTLPMDSIISRDGTELYISTGRGNSVAIVDTAKNELAAKVPVGGRVWGIALSPDGKKLYTANGATNDVSVIDLKSRKELSRIKVGDGPWGIAIGPRLP